MLHTNQITHNLEFIQCFSLSLLFDEVQGTTVGPIC